MLFCGAVSHVGGKVLLATELAFLQRRETKVHIGMKHTISNANDRCQWRKKCDTHICGGGGAGWE